MRIIVHATKMGCRVILGPPEQVGGKVLGAEVNGGRCVPADSDGLHYISELDEDARLELAERFERLAAALRGLGGAEATRDSVPT